MKKQKLEQDLVDKYTDEYKMTKGNRWNKIKGGIRGSLETLKEYISTSEYTLKQNKTKSKIAIKNKAYYQKTMLINNTLPGFISAGVGLDKGLEGKLSIDIPYLGKQDFNVFLDKDPSNPNKYKFNKISYTGLFHFSFPWMLQ